MTTSWWVGKDRDAFNAALKDHTERVMRRDPPIVINAPEPPPEIVPEPPTLSPTPTTNDAPRRSSPSSRRWNTEYIAQGLCARCGGQRTSYPQYCDLCQAKYVARVQRRTGFKAWRPGHGGRMPTRFKPVITHAEKIRMAIERDAAAANMDDTLRRAAIVMLVGFFFRQRLDWIVGWTRFSKAECRRFKRRLLHYGVWHKGGTIACGWLDILYGQRKLTKQDRLEFEIAFWLDASVANGDLTRERRGDQFFYGLPEWESVT